LGDAKGVNATGTGVVENERPRKQVVLHLEQDHSSCKKRRETYISYLGARGSVPCITIKLSALVYPKYQVNPLARAEGLVQNHLIVLLGSPNSS